LLFEGKEYTTSVNIKKSRLFSKKEIKIKPNQTTKVDKKYR